jgi:hypothetical protein
LEKKILFCPIPKAGSSNWKRIFAKLTTENYDEVDNLLEIRKVHHIQLPVLSDFSGEKQKYILDEFSEYEKNHAAGFAARVNAQPNQNNSYLFTRPKLLKFTRD